MAATHDRQRALDGSFRAGVRALGHLREAGTAVSVNAQLNAWSWRELPALLEGLIEQHAHAWQLQRTVPMGGAAERPEPLLQPYQLLEVLPLIASVHARAEANGVRIPGRARREASDARCARADADGGCVRGPGDDGDERDDYGRRSRDARRRLVTGRGTAG